jgi:hypothetical protein
MLNLSPWLPLMTDRRPERLALASLIRVTLPANSERDTAQWRNSSWRAAQTREPADALTWRKGAALQKAAAPQAATASTDAMALRYLAWHLIDSGSQARRSVGHWRFNGEAIQAGKAIEFYGEYLRDDATGALREFRLTAVGLP